MKFNFPLKLGIKQVPPCVFYMTRDCAIDNEVSPLLFYFVFVDFDFMKLHGTNPNFGFFYIGLYISMGGVFLPMHFEHTHIPLFLCVFNKCDICVYKNKRRSFVHKCNKHEERLPSCISRSFLQRSFFMLLEELSFSCFSTRARGLLSCFPKAFNN